MEDLNLGLLKECDRRFIDGINESLGAGLGLVAAIRKQVRREKAAAYQKARMKQRKAANSREKAKDTSLDPEESWP